MTKSEEIEYLALLEEEEAARSRDSLGEYATLALNVVPAKHHLLMIRELEAVERGEVDILILMFPPGSAKSTYGSVAFPAWYLGRHPERCIIAASHTAELAERFGRKVRNIFSGSDHARAFHDSKLSAESSAAGRWDTNKGGEYFAAGVGGSITGRRADLAIIDDPVKSREDADSETVRDKQWAWWRDDMSTRLKPGAAVVLIMTRWHEDDLAGRLLNDLKGSQRRVKVVAVPMEARDGDPLGRNVGDPLWPEWFTPQMLEDAKREPRTWSALYQQEPRPLGGGEFKDEWLCYWSRPPASTNRVIIVDPSSGKSKKRGDFTSMWVVGTGPDGNDYILDGIRDRLNLTERTEKLFDLVRRWKPAAVGYEQYGLQADIEHVKIEQDRQQYRFRIIELGGALKKEDRIRRLIPRFQQGLLWVPKSMPRQMSDGFQRDIMEDFRGEYLAFPVAPHDDAMDCLARIEDPEMRKFLVAPKQQDRAPSIPTFAAYDSSCGY